MAGLVPKIGALVVRTLAKPLSTRFEAYVMKHPTAREAAVRVAQRIHRLEVLVSRAAEGRIGRAFVGDLTEAKSLELASKVASEGFVFGVGLVILVFEYERQRRNDLAKRAKEAAERKAILDNAQGEREALASENRQQMALIQQLLLRVDTLEQELQRLLEEAARKHRQPKGLWGGLLGPRAASLPPQPPPSPSPSSPPPPPPPTPSASAPPTPSSVLSQSAVAPLATLSAPPAPLTSALPGPASLMSPGRSPFASATPSLALR